MSDAKEDCFCEATPPEHGGFLQISAEQAEPCTSRGETEPKPADEKAEDKPNAEKADGKPHKPSAAGDQTGLCNDPVVVLKSQLDWSHLNTGTRPVVERYSLARYSQAENRNHTETVEQEARLATHRAALGIFNARRCMESTVSQTDKNQLENTNRLVKRTQDLKMWKTELTRAIKAVGEEVLELAKARERIKLVMGVFQKAEHINLECFVLRSTRIEMDLMHDNVDAELARERALHVECLDAFHHIVPRMEEQLKNCRTVKDRLESDWSDKNDAYNFDAMNISLNNISPSLLFKPGSVVMPKDQSTLEQWQNATQANLYLLEAERSRSLDLRHTVECILIDIAKDLREQADRVDEAISRHVEITLTSIGCLDSQLTEMLPRIADLEQVICDIRAQLRSLDVAMKLAQTRLDNRRARAGMESCRDDVQYGLVAEAKTLAENVTALTAQLNLTESILADLNKSRGQVENEKRVKMQALDVDKNRCRHCRSFFPSSNALLGR